MELNRTRVKEGAHFPSDLIVSNPAPLPEKVLQFGEGNFLRSFVDWMIEEMNRAGRFNGGVVVVQPIERGLVDMLNDQQGLYTLIMRGIQDGQAVKRHQLIASIQRGLNPYTQWREVQACACNPALRVVVSNTTEAGIVFREEHFTQDASPDSFPAKLTALLYQRYAYFDGAADKGLLILPCELIDKNGDQLRKTVLLYAKLWGLPAGFEQWVEQHNYFFNTLVDRIVPGFPKEEIGELTDHLGYTDRLVTTGEVFHLWVIEGDKRFAEELPFGDVGLNVIWTDNLTPYRERKVRMLNGTHTMSVAAAYLAGLDTVREAVEDTLVGRFMRKGLFEEILPYLDLPEEEKKSFATEVLQRFKNPFIHHRWIDIALNSISKFKTRCLPSLLDYARDRSSVPPLLSFSLAALLVFYKGERLAEGKLQCRREAASYTVIDDPQVLNFFFEAWSALNPTDGSAVESMVRRILANTGFWGLDLNTLPGMASQVTHAVQTILADGMPTALGRLMEKAEHTDEQ